MRNIRCRHRREKRNVHAGCGVRHGRVDKAGHLFIGPGEIYSSLITLYGNAHLYPDWLIGKAIGIEKTFTLINAVLQLLDLQAHPPFCVFMDIVTQLISRPS